MRTCSALLLSLLATSVPLSGCIDASSEEDLDDPPTAEATDGLSGWTAPNLKWILITTPGTAKLARFVGGVFTLVKTHSFESHWQAIGVAGNKLLWQRSDTGEVALWTIDSATGNFVSTVGLPLPGTGYKAVSISLSDDGDCPAPTLVNRTYVVTYEAPVHPVTFVRAAPELRLLSSAGTELDAAALPDAANAFATIRDFRRDRDGRWALLAQTSSTTASIAYYLPTPSGFQRLRTDFYSTTAGLNGCTLAPPPWGSLTSCALSFTDLAPGSGHAIASFQIAQSTTSQTFANNLVWSGANGAAKAYALEPDGRQATAPLTWSPGLTGFATKSVSAADDGEPGFTLLCTHGASPPSPLTFEDL